MRQPFSPIVDAGALDQLFAASQDAPVILFKHDPFCGISAAAHRELARCSGTVHLVDVAHEPELSQRVTERTGVGHESPQVLVLCAGEAAWSASHRAITADAVQHALREQGVTTG